jgi:tetratricopeptide (TPR) repeat protein
MRLHEVHPDSLLSPLTISPTESVEVQRIHEIVRPIVEVCKAKGLADDGIDADALGLAYTCCRLIGNVQEGRQDIGLLSSFRPVPLEYGRAVLRGDAVASENLASDLRADHSQSFAAHDLALFLNLSDGLGADEALAQLETLIPLALTRGDKDSVARKLAQVAGFTTLPNREKGRRLLLRVADPESRFVKLFDAEIALTEGSLGLCEQLLSQVDDDPDSAAGCLLADLRVAQQRYGESAELLDDIGRRSCEPSLLKRAARLAFSAKPCRLDLVMSSLEKAVTLLPLDQDINTNLAFAYVTLQAYPSAVPCFQRLRQAQPNDQTNLSNLARSLILANRPDEALAIYDELCVSQAPHLSAFVSRALLLSDLGRPQQAFRGLHSTRQAYWSEPGFVLAYMNLAYAANEESLAHEAFEQLWALRTSGKLPPNVLEPKTLDDAIELHNDVRQRRELLEKQLIGGKIPWLFAERLLNNVPYWGWRTRTQEIEWHVDTPGNRATFSIYTTNGYAVRATAARRLKSSNVPKRATPSSSISPHC